MGKALKPLIIILFLLSIAALVLGITLFSQRKDIKDRNVTFEQGVVTIAGKLGVEKVDTEQLKQAGRMQGQLDVVAAMAVNRMEDLAQTKSDLDTTRTDLANTKNDLSATQTKLAESEAAVVQLNDTVAQKESDLVQAQGRIGECEQAKTGLQGQIGTLNDQLSAMSDEKQDLMDQIGTLEKALADTLPEMRKPPPTGLTGRILVVNPDWNFVVLDVGSEAGLGTQTELIVYRTDQLVGRVRVSSVQNQTAVAEILQDWQQQPLREGDHVLF
jgi:hypothetical protein